MAVWKVARLGRASSLTGTPFAPDTPVVTALFGEDEAGGEDRVRGAAFVRRDYLVEEATPERLAGAFCVWLTRTPSALPPARRPLDLGMAREFLQRLLEEGREDRAPVAFALSLLLLRKRRLRLAGQDEQRLRLAWPRETATFEVPVPVLTEKDREVLEQDLRRLFDL